MVKNLKEFTKDRIKHLKKLRINKLLSEVQENTVELKEMIKAIQDMIGEFNKEREILKELNLKMKMELKTQQPNFKTWGKPYQ